VVSSLAISSGKKFTDFFNPKRHPENMKGWPSMDHQTLDKKQMICLKFQTHGLCPSAACNFSHFDPRQVERSTYDKIATKFREVYKK
jgi:hypothetical protein